MVINPIIKQDIQAFRGVSCIISWQFKDKNGNIIPLNGVVAKSQIREEPGGSLVTEFVSQVFESDGKVVLSLTEAMTEAIPAKAYQYDVKLSDMNGNSALLVRGFLYVSEPITKDGA